MSLQNVEEHLLNVVCMTNQMFSTPPLHCRENFPVPWNLIFQLFNNALEQTTKQRTKPNESHCLVNPLDDMVPFVFRENASFCCFAE